MSSGTAASGSRRERSRSPRDSQHSGGSRHHTHRDRSSRSRSSSPSHRHHRDRSPRRHSRSRSRSRSDRHRHSQHRSRHEDESRVKREPDDDSKTAPAAALAHTQQHSGAATKSEHGAVKAEQRTAYDPTAAAAASIALPVSSGMKLEHEPTEADLTAALEAAAAAALPPLPQSATRAPPANVVAGPVPKQEVSYGLSGRLAAEQTSIHGVQSKYTEPPDARMPTSQWRLYVFKGKESLPPLFLHKQSRYIVGREESTCDIHVAHPSCSKQHAVIQFRQREVQRPDGQMSWIVKPYIMDLGSTNGTSVAGIKREAHKYYELLPNDLLTFGFSTREYVLINSDKEKK